MLKWFSNDEGESGSGAPGSPHGGSRSGEVQAEEMADRLVQTQQLVTQLKDLIREKDATLFNKDEQLKMEKEACEAKLSKLRLQNKAKVTSLTTQLEELKKQMGGQDTPTHKKKGPSEVGEQATRGKIVLLKKKVEELEQHLAQSEKEIEKKRTEVEAQRLRGEEMDVMLTEKDKKLAEKEAYIIHLQTSTAGDHSITSMQQKVDEDHGAMQELEQLVQSLNKKVGEAEERYSLLQEQTDSLKELLDSEKEQYSQKESMYKQNIQTFKEIILQKDNQLTEINQMHEQELFKLAAKSDASADLEQLLKALKQKLHEKEEVLIGKAQVIDVLQKEVDSRDHQIKELTERMRRLHIERESLESKMEAEKHVMRAQLRDLMEKQQAEIQRVTEKHQAQLNQTQQDLLGQIDELRRNSVAPPSVIQEALRAENVSGDSASVQKIAELKAQTKQKTEEASRSEAKFLKTKAWSKTRIRQLEDELKKSQAGVAPPDLTALRSRITELEMDREENFWKVEQYEELKANNEMLEAKLMVYEEQQRSLQADLEQFTKRATSQASESGSTDDAQSQVLEWQEMVDEAVSAREEKASMVLRISHMEEEREALATRQQGLEEELAQAQGLSQHRAHKKLAVLAQRSVQEDFEFDGKAPFQDYQSTSESTTPMEGENMGGWWPEYSTPDTDGLRTVVEELERERNQLQEQILSLEERCQGLEDRLQLQARIETLQNETDKLQTQLASVRSQHNREAEKHQLVVSSLNEQLKGLSDTQECLESSLIEKEHILAKTSEKLELINSLKESLSEKEIQYKEMSDKLLQTEQALEIVSKKSSISEKHCSELKAEVTDLTQKLSGLRDKTQKQDIILDTLQTEVDQTNEELDKLNTSHLEERAQLIHDLQSCEREIDILKDILLEKDKALNGNILEYTEQVTFLKQELRLKEENLVQVENALTKANREATIVRDSQTADQQALNSKIAELVGNLKDVEMELDKAKEESKSKAAEMDYLIKQAKDDKKTIQDLQSKTQKLIVNHHTELSECKTVISSLKEQLTLATQRQQESNELILQLKEIKANNDKNILNKEETYENELKTIKHEQNKLLSQVEKYSHDMESLSRELKERIQSEDNVQEEMEKCKKIIASLESQLKANNEQAMDDRQSYGAELQARESENKKLCKELDDNIENMFKMKDLLKHMETEKEQLQEKLKNLNENLELQNLNGNQLNEKVASALELNNNLKRQVQNLTKENTRLELEVTERVATILEIKNERDFLHVKLSALESQHLQNNTIICELEKNREDLILQNTDLKRVLEQSTLSNNEVVLVKTNECSNLNQLLREKEDTITQLQGQLQSYISEVDELSITVGKKQQLAADLEAELEAQRSEEMQLKETLSLLQEQDCSLKSELLEKDTSLTEKQEECHHLQNEIIFHRNSVSKLQVEVESLNSERAQLSKDLGEREMMVTNIAQQCQKHKNDLDNVNKTVKALKNEINEKEEKSRKLKSEADSRETELRTIKSEMHTIAEENKQLHADFKSRENELDKKIHIVSNLDQQLTVTLEQNSSYSMKITSLMENNEHLEKELAQKISLAFELNTEISLLKEQKSELEVKIANDKKIINDLLNEKNELIGSLSNAKQALQEKEMSNEECLPQKTNECSTLSKTLSERDQQIQTLQEQVNDLKIQISQLNLSMVEKEEILVENNSRLDAQQIQQMQLQDTISMLQEQGSVLKTALMEKDTMLQQKSDECIVHQNEVMLQKDLVLQMQCEVDSVRQECLETKQQIEQKEHMLKDITSDFENQKEELNQRSQSMIELESQHVATNKSLEELQIKITNLKDSVETLTLENRQLTQENELIKGEVINLKDAIQALNDQNVRLTSELQKSYIELSKAHEEHAHLKTAVNDSKLQIKTAQSEKEHLNLTIQGKDDSLKELESRISEREEQLRQKDNETFSLRGQVTELGDSVCKLRDQVQSLTTESTTLKNIMERKEQSCLEDQRNVSLVTEKLTVNLQDKGKECERLKEQISHLEESAFKINNTLQMQITETKDLKKSLEERDCSLMEQSQSLQNLQRTADELLLFKTQFMKSTELVSQLQSQMQILSSDASDHKKSAEEKQSALNNLQEKYAANLEDLQDMRKQLSQRSDTAKITIETLRDELSSNQHKLEETRNQSSQLSKEKDEAFASHQASVTLLTVEIERLKAQHLQVVAQMNALTENLEQREMALHAINNQYTAQAKHTSHLISEIQRLELHNKELNEEISLSREEHQRSLTAVNDDNRRLDEDFRKHFAEKEELERRHHQICESQRELKVQLEQKSSSMSESIQQMVYDKESLQTKVSAQDEEMSRLKDSNHKMEQILQDTEKEWLLVLDREKHDKKLLVEQLSNVENEIASKDVKVNALKQDLDSLQDKLAEAFSAIKKGSDLLSAKEFEASTSRIQLEKVLVLVKEKDNETKNLKRALKAVEQELEQLAAKFSGADIVFANLHEDQSHLHQKIKQVEASHYFEVDALKNKFDSTIADFQKMQIAIYKENNSNFEKSQEITLLQEKIDNLQTHLKIEAEKVTETSLERSKLHGELKTKDDQINSMTIQISQQKELLVGLSQQLKEKDASISQVMESALNERVKLDSQNAYLSKQLAIIQHDYCTSTQQYKEISLQLEESNSCLLRENEIKTSEKLELLKENNDLKCEIARLSKEKDIIKKKLQASLLIRKDLLKKIEDLVKKYDSINNDSDISRLQDKLMETTTQAHSAAKVYEERISLIEKECLDKEREIYYHKMQTEKLEQLESEKNILQSTVSEKESCLAEMLQKLNAKSVLIQQLQASAAEQEDIFEQDKKSLMKNLEELQKKITGCADQSKDGAFSNTNAAELENKLAQMKQERGLLQKKTQAALLARKETLKKAQENEKQLTKELNEVQDNYKALLEQHRQQTNEFTAIQVTYNENLGELERLQRTLFSNLDELKILRQLVQEKDETVQDLKNSLAESDTQSHSLAQLEIKDKAQGKEEERAETLAPDLQAHRVFKEDTAMVVKCQEIFKGVKVMLKQEKQSQLKTNNVMYQETEKNKIHLDQVLTIQRVLAEAQQRLCEKEYSLTKILEQTQLGYAETETNVVSLKQDNANALRIIDELRTELGMLHTELNQCKCVKELIYEEIPERSIKEEHVNRSTEDIESAPKHKAKLAISEKDELIASLQLQLQQLCTNHEISIMRMKREIEHLHKSQEDRGKVNDQDNQNKMTLLTKKLQAALVSRKELIKEKVSLQEEVGNLSAKINTKEAECLALESSFSRLKQQNRDLEIDMKCVNTDKEKLTSEVERILNDNCSLSDACESLKQTIENITQQKQAFSCQLESLKDSQTEELTKWKSRHSELKQDYETLLQAYENVGTEMNKMRQLLEGAKSDRQDALRKLHKYETEMKILQGKARQVEEEHERLQEKMQTFSEEKHVLEDLQQENANIKKQLAEINETHRLAICDLTDKNQHYEAEILQLKSPPEACKHKITDTQIKNGELTEKFNALEKQCMESKGMQVKLDKALSANSLLTAQIEAHKAKFSVQLESNNVLQKENKSLSENLEKMHNGHEMQLRIKDDEFTDMMSRHSQETISLNEKVRILEDDKCLLQEELENIQEILDKVKNENEYLQAQNSQLSSNLAISKEINDTVRQEKDEGHLKLVRDFEDKLKSVQRGKEGSKNMNKELQGLLKEKHQEINQLQQNCIKYQEHILHLETTLKTSEFSCENLKIDLSKSSDKISVVEEQNKQDEANLITCKTQIQEATERIGKLQSERDHLKLALENVSSVGAFTEKTKLTEATVEKQLNSFKDNEVMLQKQIDDLKNLNNHESRKVTELKQQIDLQNLKMTILKRTFETNEVKLSALSSTPHGENATKLWNDLFQNSLQQKDNQLIEQGSAMKRLLDDMRLSEKEVNELRLTKLRLESELNGYSVASAAHQRQILFLSASNAELAETVELLTVQVNNLSVQVQKVQEDRSTFEIQLADKEDEISHLHLHGNLAEKINADLDSQMLLLQAENDKLQAEFENQKGISFQLKTLLQSKDAEISSLLSCRDDHMSGYLEQLQANCHSEEAVYEDRLTTLQHQKEKADKEFRKLEAKLRNLQISLNKSVQEKEQVSAKMEVIKKSLASVQSEKERLVSEYRILEAKSHLELKSEEVAPDNVGGATRGLKYEIKKLLHQMDDLNSENAMLRAQLIRYREDFNQVLSLKDNQLKVLLKKQEDVIQNLENQKTAAEKQYTEALSDLQKEREVICTLKEEVSKLRAQVIKLQSELVSQKATKEGKVVADLQQTVAPKTAECIDLQQKLLSQETQIDNLKKQMELLENETDKKLANADDKNNTELVAYERKVDLMRTERERAEQRVTELARGQLEMEHQLLEAQRQNKDLKAQNESLCKAMAALQNDRDQLIEDFKVLQNSYDEELKETRAALNKVERSFQDATSDVAMFTKEREIHVHELRALRSKDSHAELNKLLGKLTKDLTEKEKQLQQVVLENSTYSRQLSAFSKSMASLQNDRDRLVDELAGATRVVESRQGSSLNTVRTMSVKRSKGSDFQIEKHGAMNELPRSTPEKEANSFPHQTAISRSERVTQPVKGTVNPVGQSEMEVAVSRLEAERVQLHRELQRCLFDIQQRDQYFQQLNSEGSVNAEVASGAPQERNNTVVAQTIEVARLQESISSSASQDLRRDFSSIEIDADDEWEAVSLNPNQPLITRKVKGGLVACRRWFRGRSLYFSRLLTSRARSRYFFLAYLVTIHMLVLMCLTGAL
ncbi:uncharacterized protein LOC144050542 isoform X3 [Vanacampus margaritifer]